MTKAGIQSLRVLVLFTRTTIRLSDQGRAWRHIIAELASRCRPASSWCMEHLVEECPPARAVDIHLGLPIDARNAR